MIATIKTVIKKEWRDSIRDRRSMTAAVMFSIFGPVLIAVMISITAERETSNEPFKVHVQGAGYANDLSAFLTPRPGTEMNSSKNSMSIGSVNPTSLGWWADFMSPASM